MTEMKKIQKSNNSTSHILSAVPHGFRIFSTLLVAVLSGPSCPLIQNSSTRVREAFPADFSVLSWPVMYIWVQLLATGTSAAFFRLHFLGSLAPIELWTGAEDRSCIHCPNRAPKQQHTESFFALCENWGGLYSFPLCWCLSTALFEARPIVLASVSYWPKSVPAMFPGSKLRVRECLERGNHRLDAFCCIVIWPIKSNCGLC